MGIGQYGAAYAYFALWAQYGFVARLLLAQYAGLAVLCAVVFDSAHTHGFFSAASCLKYGLKYALRCEK